jgi:hypothetical protein
LFALAERLEICRIINDCVGKREGLPFGDSILSAAINRALKPVSKNAFFEDWFSCTVFLIYSRLQTKPFQTGILEQYVPNKKNAIRLIEDETVTKIADKYYINTECLLFDSTIFIKYTDTDNPAKLPQRGKS